MYSCIYMTMFWQHESNNWIVAFHWCACAQRLRCFSLCIVTRQPMRVQLSYPWSLQKVWLYLNPFIRKTSELVFVINGVKYSIFGVCVKLNMSDSFLPLVISGALWRQETIETAKEERWHSHTHNNNGGNSHQIWLFTIILYSIRNYLNRWGFLQLFFSNGEWWWTDGGRGV